MRWLSDATVDHLRSVADEPDFSATRYTIVREIARGGMGVIYEADDRELQRRVAIKVLATELAAPDAVERLRAEARTIARLEHPGIVPVHDVGVLPDGRAWYAMKLVRGDVLSAGGVARAPHERLRIFLRVCDAVAFAHAHGVVHRDLKPENIMIGSFGEVLVMDWGVAAVIGDHQEQLVVGTRGFMAPEQERAEVADQRSDLFALGAILQVIADRAAKPLRAIISKAMSPSPGDRYPDAQALGNDVARYVDGLAVEAYRENVLERSWRWLNRNRALVAMVLAYLIMRVLVYLYGRS